MPDLMRTDYEEDPALLKTHLLQEHKRLPSFPIVPSVTSCSVTVADMLCSLEHLSVRTMYFLVNH